MEIRVVDKSVDKIVSGAKFLGCGASKEAFLKDNIVYKVPRGRYAIQNAFDLPSFPNTIEEVDSFLRELVEQENQQLVWPLGQFAIELLVWEALTDLESKGLDISCFARIQDYYYDRDGVIIIEQELTKPLHLENEEVEEKYNDTCEEIEMLETILDEEYGITLRDIRQGNMGLGADGRVKVFDFGISTTTSIDDYGSYSDYSSCGCSE